MTINNKITIELEIEEAKNLAIMLNHWITKSERLHYIFCAIDPNNGYKPLRYMESLEAKLMGPYNEYWKKFHEQNKTN